MAGPFALLEARVNAAVMGRIANATVTLDGSAVEAIFDGSYSTLGVNGEAAQTLPQITVADADVPANPVDKPVVISTGAGAGTYRVVESQPDGAGLTILLLERTS